MPGAKVASTRRIFSAAVQRRRRWTDVMISTRSEVLVIDTVISLTLPKWETLSGQFRGNLKRRAPAQSELWRKVGDDGVVKAAYRGGCPAFQNLPKERYAHEHV